MKTICLLLVMLSSATCGEEECMGPCGGGNNTCADAPKVSFASANQTGALKDAVDSYQSLKGRWYADLICSKGVVADKTVGLDIQVASVESIQVIQAPPVVDDKGARNYFECDTLAYGTGTSTIHSEKIKGLEGQTTPLSFELKDLKYYRVPKITASGKFTVNGPDFSEVSFWLQQDNSGEISGSMGFILHEVDGRAESKTMLYRCDLQKWRRIL